MLSLKAFKSFIKRTLVSINSIPKHLSKKFLKIEDTPACKIKSSLKQNYFTRQIWGDVAVTAESWLSSDEGKRDLDSHLYDRLNSFRRTVIPWLDHAKPLLGAKILEIGCGTGASTVALAEQGAQVTSVDVDEGSLAVAKDRCQVYGLEVDFYKANAKDLDQLFSNQQFDFIIFFAALEHLTVNERMAAIKNTWDMLSDGSLWCVIETPNRLWHFDSHTSLLPFFYWLPEELAFQYSKFSPRKPFCDAYRDCTEDTMLNFRRQGLGVSYHEFDLAMKKVEELKVVSSLKDYLSRIVVKKSYESFLAKQGPKIHSGFYKEYLNLIIEKD